MLTIAFLWFAGLGWLGYGIYCFLVPGTLTEFAGLTPDNATALVEIQAMYGGLQSAVGVMALIGATWQRWRSAALLALSCLYTGLGSTRTIAATMAGDCSTYTIGALSFELASALISIWLLRRSVAG